VGDLDLLALLAGEDDARLGEHRRGALARLRLRHSDTGAFVSADACSASRARAWPSASSRPSSSGASPRIASETFSSSSRFTIAVPQSKVAITSFGNRIVPVKTQSVPDGPYQASPHTRSGSPARRRDPETL